MMGSALEKSKGGRWFILNRVVRGSLTKLTVEQRSKEHDGAGQSRASKQKVH